MSGAYAEIGFISITGFINLISFFYFKSATRWKETVRGFCEILFANYPYAFLFQIYKSNSFVYTQ